jgi:DNA-binding NtrC family response regulator
MVENHGRMMALKPRRISMDVKHLRKQLPKEVTAMAGQKGEDLTLEAVIKSHIERVLHMTGYNRSQAARILGLPLSTLRSKMKKLGIETEGERKAVASNPSTSDISPPAGDLSLVVLSI